MWLIYRAANSSSNQMPINPLIHTQFVALLIIHAIWLPFSWTISCILGKSAGYLDYSLAPWISMRVWEKKNLSHGIRFLYRVRGWKLRSCLYNFSPVISRKIILWKDVVSSYRKFCTLMKIDRNELDLRLANREEGKSNRVLSQVEKEQFLLTTFKWIVTGYNSKRLSRNCSSFFPLFLSNQDEKKNIKIRDNFKISRNFIKCKNYNYNPSKFRRIKKLHFSTKVGKASNQPRMHVRIHLNPYSRIWSAQLASNNVRREHVESCTRSLTSLETRGIINL